jgi:hypothetical protein
LAGDENNGDRCCCRLGYRSYIFAGRGNHGDLPSNQFRGQLWKPIELILGPAIHDRHVVAFHIAIIFESLAIGAQTFPDRIR